MSSIYLPDKWVWLSIPQNSGKDFYIYVNTETKDASFIAPFKFENLYNVYKTYFGEALDCNIIDIQNKISQSTDSINRPERSNSQSYAHEPLDTRIHDKAKKEKTMD